MTSLPSGDTRAYEKFISHVTSETLLTYTTPRKVNKSKNIQTIIIISSVSILEPLIVVL